MGLGNSSGVGGGEEGVSWACKGSAGWVEEWGYSKAALWEEVQDKTLVAEG